MYTCTGHTTTILGACTYSAGLSQVPFLKFNGIRVYHDDLGGIHAWDAWSLP